MIYWLDLHLTLKGVDNISLTDFNKSKTKIVNNNITVNARGYVIDYEHISYDDFYSELRKIRHFLANFYSLREQILKCYNDDLLCILVDLTVALENIYLSNQDLKILQDYMNGYSLTDIGKKYNFTRSNADFTIKKITKRLQDYLLGVNE